MPRPVHFDLTADDPERAAAFYRDVFEWTVERWDNPGGADYWLITTGDEEPGIDGGLGRRTEESIPGTMNTVAVTDLDASLAAVTAAGGTVLSEPMEIAGVGALAYCADTEGNAFGLMQPAS